MDIASEGADQFLDAVCVVKIMTAASAALRKREPRWKRHSKFLAALNEGNVPMAWTLLCGCEEPLVDPDVRIMTGGEYKPAICIAVEKDLLDMAELLIMCGCSVNQSSPTGLSPLHIAVMRNNADMVRLLLKSGASVSCRDSNGRTPLHQLAVCNYEIARLLVQKDGKTEYRDRNGATPLALACKGHRALALCLLSLGANASAGDNEGNTPLHHTCAKVPNDEELVKHLLAAGAQASGSSLAARGSQRVSQLVPVWTKNSAVVTCVGNPRQPEAARRSQNRTLGQLA
ncbi:hypothetical protein HPB51_026192 [Rhipicephalus microplus]|uniref:Alpha-latrotoxin n=1 Tax=Rhipicephalus microplus TaxID=6941 RepID=A0A9J6DY85_RHIMP|nr:hypothetical protein HPB51_026192 [Rhipicephalus microplus]